jgi:hypothetical protein
LHWWLMKKICVCCSNIFEKHIFKNCHDLSLWSLTSNPALNPALMREREREGFNLNNIFLWIMSIIKYVEVHSQSIKFWNSNQF